MHRILVNAALVLLFTATTSLAQQPPAAPAKPAPSKPGFKLRVYVSVDGGYQSGTEDFSNGGTFTQYLEQARFDTAYELKSGPQFQVAGGVGVWKNLHAGVAFSRFNQTTATTVTGAIPHPFFFSRPRSIDGEVTGLKREETAIHLQARVVLPATRRITAAVFAGPSWFSVKQGIVGGIQYTESYPFDSAAFQSATTSRPSAKEVGFNAGGEMSFFFLNNLGVGGSVQFTRAEVSLPVATVTEVTTNVGGVQYGVGLRVRF